MIRGAGCKERYRYTTMQEVKERGPDKNDRKEGRGRGGRKIQLEVTQRKAESESETWIRDAKGGTQKKSTNANGKRARERQETIELLG
jgi:hypothetical protein